MRANKIRYTWFLVITLIFFLMWFALNRLTLYTADDFAYKFVYEGFLPEGNLKKIDGLASVIQSQINHWKLWNGRFVAHFMVQYILQFDKVFFDILNSLAVPLLAVLILKIGYFKSNSRILPIMYFLVLSFLWFFMPDIGTSVMWVSGSGNYLWTSLIYMYYFYLVIKYTEEDIGPVKGIAILLLAFISGACNENSSPTILLLSFIYMVYKWILDREWNWWLFSSLVAGGIGFITMMLSPGSIDRGTGNRDPNLLANNLRSINHELLIRYQYIYLLFGLLILYIIIKRIRINSDAIVLSLLLFSGYFISAYVLVVAPEISPRTFFCSFVFLATSIVILISNVYRTLNTKLNRLISISTLITLLISYFTVYADLKKTHSQVEHQYRLLREASSDSEVLIPMVKAPTTAYNAYAATANVSIDKSMWFNQWMAYYFEVKSVTGYPVE